METSMSLVFPTNTIVVIVLGMIGVGAAFWFVLSHLLRHLPLTPHTRQTWRWGAALVLLVWLTVCVAAAINPPGGAVVPPLFPLIFLVGGLLVGTIPLLLSPAFRQSLRAIPPTWLVGIHAIRVGGFAFLALLDMKLLPAAFALPAGYGDMSVALLSLGVVYLLATQHPAARVLAIGWNVLGLLDFAIAVVTGVLSLVPFLTQLAASGVSPLYLNYVLIRPAFGVPLYALLHLYSLFQMVRGRAQEAKPEGEPGRIVALQEAKQELSYGE
jgi:hypothetical protein